MRFNRRVKAGIFLLLLILALFSWVPVPTVAADGASSTEEVWVEFKSGWEGQAADADGYMDIEETTCASKVDLSAWDFDVLNITDVRAYVDNDDGAGDRDYRIGIWNWTADNNGGKRFGYIEFTHDDTVTFGWKDTTGAGPISVDENVFFIGAWAESIADVANLAYSTSGGTKKSIITVGGFAADPFAETTSFGDRTYNIQFRGWGYKNTTTTHNLYYGGASNYTARRDVNYTAPSGATNRQMRTTYPVDEYLVNITRSNGGAFDQTLSTSDYTDVALNATHNVLTLGDTTISLYGWDYRIYTASYLYLYTLTGPTFENGTRDYTGINVTATLISGSETFTLDGTDIKGFNNTVLLFSWSLSGGGTRLFYPRENYETITVYIPEDDYAIYSFDIKDYSGKIGDQDSYIEAFRYISGTSHLIERAIIQNAATDVPLVLVYSQAYMIRLYLSDGTIYSFGYFIAGLDTSPIIIVSAISFSDQVQASQKYILFEATRSTDGTVIQVEYEDERNMTASILLEIRYLNHSVAHSDSAVDTGEVQFQWNSANNVTDYYVWARAVTPEPPTYMGNVTYNWPLPGLATQVSTPFDIAFAVGNTTVMSSSNLVPVGLTLAISVTSSVVWTPLGLFVTIILSAIMLTFGWVSYSGTLLTAAMCFAFIFGIYVAKKELSK